jgi:hypothetical protein
MTSLHPLRAIGAALGLMLLINAVAENPAWAGNHHRTQVITAQAPVVYTAQAPAVYAAPAQAVYAAPAQATYAAQAPAVYMTAQAPATYAAQAPAVYMTAQAPAYGSAPGYYTPSTASAPAGAPPGAANAPATGIRVSNAIRQAIEADLVAYYQNSANGDDRIERIRDLRERARDGYTSFLEDEEDGELNAAERKDVNDMVDRVIANSPAGSDRTFYPPSAGLGPAGYRPAGYGPAGYGPAGYGPTPILVQPTALVQQALPVQAVGVILVPRHQCHPLKCLFNCPYKNR